MTILSFAYYWSLNYFSLKKLTKPKNRIVLFPERKAFERISYRILDLDGGLLLQQELINTLDNVHIISVQDFGPSLRIECNFSQWYHFENFLSRTTGTNQDDQLTHSGPLITFYGSNDYHHISLALIRRFQQPFNFVILDNHPDWIEYFIGLHCGSWFNHVCDLPNVQQAFHLGGHSGEFEASDVRFLTPWKHIIGENPKIKVMPASNKFCGHHWSKTKQKIMRKPWHRLITKERVTKLFKSYSEQLKRYPLYITLDKDVMTREYALQNWNSGILCLEEVLVILETLIRLSCGNVIAIDITGDFTTVKTNHFFRSYLHHSQHDDSENNIDQALATKINERTNLAIINTIKNTFQEFQ